MKTSSDITYLHKELSAAPETALRYERAYFGARELMCYVAWRKALTNYHLFTGSPPLSSGPSTPTKPLTASG